MRIRLRGPQGVSTITLADTATIADLQSAIATSTSLAKYEVKSGFPPAILHLDSYSGSTTLEAAGLNLNGEQLIIEGKGSAPVITSSITAPSSKPNQTPNDSTPASTTQPSTSSDLLSLQRKENDLTDVPEIPLPSHSAVLVLRIMPDDNSCLFRALGSAVLGSSLDAMTELRSLVATKIQSDTDSYSAAILGKEPSAYCRWIQREDSWGGGVELAILSQQFDIEICSVDVQSLRVDRFNEGRPTRCILVYSGIHYDVVALTPGAEVPDEFDTKVFDAADEAVLAAALQLCQRLQEKHYYTDTAGFGVRCNDCGWTGNGEKAAVKHAEASGHTDFGEA